MPVCPTCGLSPVPQLHHVLSRSGIQLQVRPGHTQASRLGWNKRVCVKAEKDIRPGGQLRTCAAGCACTLSAPLGQRQGQTLRSPAAWLGPASQHATSCISLAAKQPLLQTIGMQGTIGHIVLLCYVKLPCSSCSGQAAAAAHLCSRLCCCRLGCVFSACRLRHLATRHVRRSIHVWICPGCCRLGLASSWLGSACLACSRLAPLWRCAGMLDFTQAPGALAELA